MMDALIGLTGLFGFLITLIILLITVIRKKRKKNVLIAMGIFFAMFVVALSMTESSSSGKLEEVIEEEKTNIVASDEGSNDDLQNNVSIEATNKSNKDTASEIINLIDSIDIQTLTAENASTIEEISAKYDLLTEEEKEKISNYKILVAAETKLNYLKEEAEKELAMKLEAEKKLAEEQKVQEAIQSEKDSASENMSEEDYKALCVDYPYAELVKDETTYLDTYIKKDLMVRDIVTYTPTGETVYACGEKKEGGSYVGGLFYVFDRRSNAEKEIELYDKIYLYGKVKEIQYVNTWSNSSIYLYVDGVYIDFNGKFGE